MKLLLDTHVLIWSLFAAPNLSKEAEDLILDPDNEVVASVASVWEIAIKNQRCPDTFPLSEDLTADLCDDAGYRQWRIEAKHVFALKDLRRSVGLPKHQDPFDQILLAQALAEDAVLLTHDARLGEYEGPKVILI